MEQTPNKISIDELNTSILEGKCDFENITVMGQGEIGIGEHRRNDYNFRSVKFEGTNIRFNISNIVELCMSNSCFAGTLEIQETLPYSISSQSEKNLYSTYVSDFDLDRAMIYGSLLINTTNHANLFLRSAVVNGNIDIVNCKIGCIKANAITANGLECKENLKILNSEIYNKVNFKESIIHTVYIKDTIFHEQSEFDDSKFGQNENVNCFNLLNVTFEKQFFLKKTLFCKQLSKDT